MKYLLNGSHIGIERKMEEGFERQWRVARKKE